MLKLTIYSDFLDRGVYSARATIARSVNVYHPDVYFRYGI